MSKQVINHYAAIKEAITELENKGFRVIRLKNNFPFVIIEYTKGKLYHYYAK
jgi:hypothetical protein